MAGSGCAPSERFLVSRVRAAWWLPAVIGVLIGVGTLSTPADGTHGPPQSLFSCSENETGWDEHTCKAHLSWADITWHFSDDDPGDPWPGEAQTAVKLGSYAWENGHAIDLIEDDGSPNHIYYDPQVGGPFVKLCVVQLECKPYRWLRDEGAGHLTTNGIDRYTAGTFDGWALFYEIGGEWVHFPTELVTDESEARGLVVDLTD